MTALNGSGKKAQRLENCVADLAFYSSVSIRMREPVSTLWLT